jgi:hypothetical protein
MRRVLFVISVLLVAYGFPTPARANVGSCTPGVWEIEDTPTFGTDLEMFDGFAVDTSFGQSVSTDLKGT